jgi:hypothetical protein
MKRPNDQSIFRIDWQIIDSDDESEENEAEESGGWDEVDQTEDDEIDFNEKMIVSFETI